MIDRTPEITFSLTFVSSMSELLKRMILNGDGVGWLPQYSIQRELDEGRLTILDESLSLPIGAWLYRSGSRLNQAAERFWQHIKTRNEPRNNPQPLIPRYALRTSGSLSSVWPLPLRRIWPFTIT